MRSTLAIYITLFAIAAMAIVQILYWRLVINRDDVRADDTAETGWQYEPVATWPELKPVATWPELELQHAAPAPVRRPEPSLAPEPVLVAAAA